MSSTGEEPLTEGRERPRDALAVPELQAEELSKRFDDVLEQKQYVTSKIGETCRFIAFGLVAISFTALSSNDEFFKDMRDQYGFAILMVAALGCLSILSDYMQYFFGYNASILALKNSDGKNAYLYKKPWKSYRLRELFFGLSSFLLFRESSRLFF